jgi:hypothetical protein
VYCENCGNKLNDTAKFCPACGTRVAGRDAAITTSVPVAPSSPKRQSEPVESEEPKPLPRKEPAPETALMVLAINKKEGLLKRTSAHLVFFSDRLVIADLTAERQKQENAALSAQIKADGKGFFQGSAAMMEYWRNFSNRYYSMSPADILNEDRNNLEVAHADVHRFTFRRYDSDDDAKKNGGDIEIDHRYGKLKASHTYGDGNQNIKSHLERFYGGRIKYRGSKVLFSKGQRDGFI